MGKRVLGVNKSNLVLYIIGLCVSIALLGIYFINKENPWCIASCGVGGSGVGAILLAFFIEMNNLKSNKDFERKLILRNLKAFRISLENYIFTFNLLTTNSRSRFVKGISSKKINKDFLLNDLNGIFTNKIGFEFGLSDMPLQEYNFAQRNLIEKTEQMLNKIDFNFFLPIESCLLGMLTALYNNKGLDHLIQYKDIPMLKECMYGIMEKYSGIPEQDVKDGTYSGNLFLPIILLFLNLKNLPIIIENMQKEIENLFLE